MVMKFNAENCLNIGEIYREHGVKGTCKFYAYGGTDLNLEVGKTYFLQRNDGEIEKVKITSVVTNGRYFLIHFDLFNSPEALVVWRKAKLWLAKDKLSRENGALYDFEWQGLDVFDEAGAKLGEIVRVEYAPLKQFLVATNSGDVLVPCVADWIVTTDLAHKRVVMRLPEGL